MVKKGFKWFIGYKVAKKTRHVCIFLPKISAYRRYFDETIYMSFWINDDELLEIYNDIWEKIEIVPKKNLIMNLYTMKNI